MGSLSEANRPRYDRKVWSSQGYLRALAFANRTVHHPSEFYEIMQAAAQSDGNIEAFLMLQGINELMDKLYGARARFLRAGYQSGYWPFPVGYDTLSHLWR